MAADEIAADVKQGTDFTREAAVNERWQLSSRAGACLERARRWWCRVERRAFERDWHSRKLGAEEGRSRQRRERERRGEEDWNEREVEKARKEDEDGEGGRWGERKEGRCVMNDVESVGEQAWDTG